MDVAECRCFSELPRYDLMMKSRRQQTQTLERQREQTTSILESESKTEGVGEGCDLFVTFYLSVTYRKARLGTLFISASFILFKQFENLVFDCVYVIRTRSLALAF